MASVPRLFSMSFFTFAHHNCALPEPTSIAFFEYRLIHSLASHCLMCSKVSGEIETFDGASLGVGIAKPFPDLVKDFLGVMSCHFQPPMLWQSYVAVQLFCACCR
jgi:hypothetical protein